MTKYKVCIIGCGDIGFMFDHKKNTVGALTHFKAFRDSEHFELTGIAESKKEIREIIKSEYETDAYEDLKVMCADKHPEVIVIATNDQSHYDILKQAVEYNPRLVFCEKPLTLDYEKSKEIIKLYSDHKIKLQVNFTRRFLDEFYEIKNLISEEAIGEIESATFYYSRGLIHNASHYLDLVSWFFEGTEKELNVVSLKEGLHKNDETVSFNMIYDNGLEIRFIGLKPTKLSFAEVDFVGTEGRIKINYKNEIEKFKVTGNKTFSGYSSYELYEARSIEFQKALPNAVDNIYNYLSGSEELKSPAEHSLKIFELINRIREKGKCQN